MLLEIAGSGAPKPSRLIGYVGCGWVAARRFAGPANALEAIVIASAHRISAQYSEAVLSLHVIIDSFAPRGDY